MTAEFNPFNLEGKTILITGASSGIGRQCAIDCSLMGARIILIARNNAKLTQVLDELHGYGHKSVAIDIDTIPKTFISELTAEVGSIDGFIHSAGIEKTLPFKLLKTDDFSNVMRTNAFSGFEIAHQLVNKGNLANGASLIFISSISSIIARSGLSAYAASKGAINSAVKVMAVELAKKNIRVNSISPGTILTPMMQNILSNMTEEQRANRIAGFPLGLGNPTDISNACIYLLSDASRWITGQNIVIDGGYTCL